MKALLPATILTATAFTLASLAYWAIEHFLGAAFGALMSMFLYHEAHPFQYIGLVALAYGILGTCWLRYFQDSRGWKRCLSIFTTLLLSLVLASIPGGVLWKIHDMQAGFFPEGIRFWQDLWWGAKTGLALGLLIMMLSFPLNLIGLIAGGTLLHISPNLLARLGQNQARKTLVHAGRKS